MERISVIIPCYNRASLVGETIDNMLRQTRPPDELIVVDDGSTDNSVDVIKSYGERVQLIQQKNAGPGAARNAGFRASSGTLIQFMDSDDLASLNKLEEQAKALDASKYDFAYCPWVRTDIEEKKIKFLEQVLQSERLPDTKPMLEWFLSGWSLVFQNCMFKRSILEKAGSYRTDLMPSEDSEYFTRILLAGARPVFTPNCLIFYREHTINKITASGTSSIHRVNDWTHYLDITGRLLEKKLPTFKPSTRLSLATSVKLHHDACSRNNLPGLTDDHPYRKLMSEHSRLQYFLVDFLNRAKRKISGSANYHHAFKAAPVTAQQKALVEAMNYSVEL